MSSERSGYEPDRELHAALVALRTQINTLHQNPPEEDGDWDLDGVRKDLKPKWGRATLRFRLTSPWFISTGAACILLAAGVGAMAVFSAPGEPTAAVAHVTEGAGPNAFNASAELRPATSLQARADQVPATSPSSLTRAPDPSLVMPLAMLPSDQPRGWPKASVQLEDPFASSPNPARSPQVAKQNRPSPPEDSSPVRAIDPKQAALLRNRADEMMANGDLPAARLILRRLAQANDAGAAYNLARTFDPAFIAQSGEIGLQPDPVQARTWYELARNLGHSEASQRLQALAETKSATVGAR